MRINQHEAFIYDTDSSVLSNPAGVRLRLYYIIVDSVADCVKASVAVSVILTQRIVLCKF